MKNPSSIIFLLVALLQTSTVIAQFNINGQITCLGSNESLSGQEVQLSGGTIVDMVSTTDVNGNYSFPNLPSGEDYSISIEREGDALNGITTFDLVLLSKYVLGVSPFANPFYQLAADVNGSGTISTLDMFIVRQVILGLITQFPNVGAYQFATSDFDPANGIGSVGGATITNLQANETIDFVQVKTGDINGSAVCQ